MSDFKLFPENDVAELINYIGHNGTPRSVRRGETLVSVGEDTNILSYGDALSVSEYAVPAFQWACGAGIIDGTTSGTLAPQGNATRAQFAVILSRFCGESA